MLVSSRLISSFEIVPLRSCTSCLRIYAHKPCQWTIGRPTETEPKRFPFDIGCWKRRHFARPNSVKWHKIRPVMRRSFSTLLAAIFFAGGLALLGARVPNSFQATRSTGAVSRTYLGFDRNRYPGDAVLGLLRRTFSFCGYWLNVPPGKASNTWQGKREILTSSGFGFLVLFNGRMYQELKSLSNPSALGTRDAAVAVEAVKKEGFPIGTIIFVDQEEGGRMLPEQRAYLYAWIDGVNASGYRAGVYCSGIPTRETGGATVITANDLRDNADGRKIVLFVYNDSCPPSPSRSSPKNVFRFSRFQPFPRQRI